MIPNIITTSAVLLALSAACILIPFVVVTELVDLLDRHLYNRRLKSSR